jgi:hypothetical protein
VREVVSSSETFDVSATSLSDYRRSSRLFRLLGLFGSTTLAVIWIGALVTLTIHPGLSHLTVSVVAGLGFVAGLIGVLALTSLLNAPGAIELEVKSDGVRLSYATGRTKQFSWTDPGTTLILYEFPETLPSGRPFPLSRFWLVTRFPQSNPVTSEAFEAVLRSAERARLSVTRVQKAIGTPRTVIRIAPRMGLGAGRAS